MSGRARYQKPGPGAKDLCRGGTAGLPRPPKSGGRATASKDYQSENRTAGKTQFVSSAPRCGCELTPKASSASLQHPAKISGNLSSFP